jgi:phosphotransferase system HPr-like phosphotransfer protein
MTDPLGMHARLAAMLVKAVAAERQAFLAENL